MGKQSSVYKARLASRKWEETRKYFSAIDRENVCARTGCNNPPTEWHHLHYKTLGNESREDVEHLCKEHHRLADLEREERERDAAAERAQARYDKGLDTFMTRRHGSEWEDKFDRDEAERLFNQQIKSRRGYAK